MFIQEDDIDWGAYLQETEEYRKVKEKSAFNDVLNQYFAGNLYSKGSALPWENAKHISLRPSEVSLWAGANGHGKSLLLGHVVLGLIEQGQKCLIASFEMRPEITLARMCRQAIGAKTPSAEHVERFSEWKKDYLYLYDHHGMIYPEQMLAVCRYAAKELGIQHLVIDSLMKTVRGEDDFNGQKDFVNEICSIARDTGLHIHLVHHMRKASNEKEIGGKYDLKGSGSITDQADNVFIVWKNKEKTQAQMAGDVVDNTIPDALLACEKQRNGEWEGRVMLWFDYASQQYKDDPFKMIKRYA